jgi:hypothetical protein
MKIAPKSWKYGLIGAVLLFPAARSAGAREQTWEKAFSLAGVHSVRVENVNGTIRARNWDRDYVRVTAAESGRERSLENTEIRTSLEDGVIRIRTVSKHHRHFLFFFWNSDRLAKVEYDLLLPPRMDVALETVNGSVHADGLLGGVRATTVNGRVEADGVGGDFRAETVNGRIWARLSAEPTAVRMHSVNGEIEAEVPADSSFRYDLETVNGRLSVGTEASRTRGLGGNHLAGEVAGGRGEIRAKSVNGSIRISFAGH